MRSLYFFFLQDVNPYTNTQSKSTARFLFNEIFNIILPGTGGSGDDDDDDDDARLKNCTCGEFFFICNVVF